MLGQVKELMKMVNGYQVVVLLIQELSMIITMEQGLYP